MIKKVTNKSSAASPFTKEESHNNWAGGIPPASTILISN